MLRGGEPDSRPSGWRSAGYEKKWKFAFASFILEKVQWVLEAIDALAIFTLGSYVLPICFLVNILFFQQSEVQIVPSEIQGWQVPD